MKAPKCVGLKALVAGFAMSLIAMEAAVAGSPDLLKEALRQSALEHEQVQKAYRSHAAIKRKPEGSHGKFQRKEIKLTIGDDLAPAYTDEEFAELVVAQRPRSNRDLDSINEFAQTADDMESLVP